jgi:hypothetical protein
VTFKEEWFARKLMTTDSSQYEFEAEAERYQLLKGSPGMEEFKRVVQTGGILRGFLNSYIDGTDLWTNVTESPIGEDMLKDITGRIMEGEAPLFYH